MSSRIEGGGAEDFDHLADDVEALAAHDLRHAAHAGHRRDRRRLEGDRREAEAARSTTSSSVGVSGMPSSQ
jgi:hypothetical protein